MYGSFGANVCEEFWKFFINAGGLPHSIKCDFDPWLIGSKAATLLNSHDTCIQDALP